MKRISILLFLLILATALLTACECNHQWVEADCLTPKTCENCQVTEGEALGHIWQDASCEVAKTCEVCGATEGAPLGHKWQEATCMEPMTCSVCSQTEGGLGGHSLDQVAWYPVWEDGELVDVEKMSGPCVCGTWLEMDMDWELVAKALIPGRWIINSVTNGSFSETSDLEETENYLDIRPDKTMTMALLGETATFTWNFTQPENPSGIWYELVAEDGSKAELCVFVFKTRPESDSYGMLVIDRWYMLDIRK